MALVQKSQKISFFLTRLNVRCYSKSTKKTIVSEKDIKKSVFISQSKDIYANLAIEDWLHQNFDFTNHHVLLLCQNDPCVVIGRHQNPWLESNFSELAHITETGVQLARRNSGGGAVYHDQGNLNLTFFTPSERYNRNYNLQLISRSLFREFGLKVDITPRDDLCIRGNKQVSSTAAKLGSTNSYHNCSVLVNANKVDLSLALHSNEINIKSNATKSIRSKIMNLCEENPTISVSKFIKAVGWEYLRTPALSVKDGGMELANKQKGFQLINPTESWFPGISELRAKYSTWNWRYGMTPKFNITRCFTVPETLLDSDIGPSDLKVTMTVEGGKISDVNLFIPPGFSPCGFTGNAGVITGLIGQKFSEEALKSLDTSLSTLVNDKEKFVTECLKQVVSCA